MRALSLRLGLLRLGGVRLGLGLRLLLGSLGGRLSLGLRGRLLIGGGSLLGSLGFGLLLRGGGVRLGLGLRLGGGGGFLVRVGRLRARIPGCLCGGRLR